MSNMPEAKGYILGFSYSINIARSLVAFHKREKDKGCYLINESSLSLSSYHRDFLSKYLSDLQSNYDSERTLVFFVILS